MPIVERLRSGLSRREPFRRGMSRRVHKWWVRRTIRWLGFVAEKWNICSNWSQFWPQWWAIESLPSRSKRWSHTKMWDQWCRQWIRSEPTSMSCNILWYYGCWPLPSANRPPLQSSSEIPWPCAGFGSERIASDWSLRPPMTVCLKITEIDNRLEIQEILIQNPRVTSDITRSQWSLISECLKSPQFLNL